MRQSRQRTTQRGGGALVPVHPYATATSVFPQSNEIRFLDAGVAALVAAAVSVWTASRTPTSALGWAAFWLGLGGLMAVEGRGTVRSIGLGTLGAEAAYLALRLTGFAKVVPTAGYAQAASLQAPAPAPYPL